MNDKTLVVVDISAMIYSGLKRVECCFVGPIDKVNNEYVDLSVPAGGIARIFDLIRKYSDEDEYDLVFCGDRYPEIKLSLYKWYKQNRQGSRNADADYQKEIAELILKHCGFNVITKDQYEADDLIYSICNLYKSVYRKILVYVNDADMYICVDDNVEIMPPASNDKHITRENYERECNKKDITPYNTVTFYKFLFGCHSDGVTALQPKWLREKIYDDLYVPKNFEILANKRYMRLVISKKYPDALNQFDLIYPLDVYIELPSYKMNRIAVAIWGAKMNTYTMPISDMDAKQYSILEDEIDSIIKKDILQVES